MKLARGLIQCFCILIGGEFLFIHIISSIIFTGELQFNLYSVVLLMAYSCLIIATFLKDKSWKQTLILIIIGALPILYYQFNELFWPINTPEFQQRLGNVGIESWRSYANIIFIGFLETVVIATAIIIICKAAKEADQNTYKKIHK